MPQPRSSRLSRITSFVSRHKWKLLFGATSFGSIYYSYRLCRSLYDTYQLFNLPFEGPPPPNSPVPPKPNVDPYKRCTDAADTDALKRFSSFKNIYETLFDYTSIIEKLKQFKQIKATKSRELLQALQTNIYVCLLSSIFHCNLLILLFRTMYILHQRYTLRASTFTADVLNEEEMKSKQEDMEVCNKLMHTMEFLLSERCANKIGGAMKTAAEKSFNGYTAESRMKYSNLIYSISKTFDEVVSTLSKEYTTEMSVNNDGITGGLQGIDGDAFQLQGLKFTSFLFDGNRRVDLDADGSTQCTSEFYDLVESPHFFEAFTKSLEECACAIAENVYHKSKGECDGMTGDKFNIKNDSSDDDPFFDKEFIFGRSCGVAASLINGTYSDSLGDNFIIHTLTHLPYLKEYARLVAYPNHVFWSSQVKNLQNN